MTATALKVKGKLPERFSTVLKRKQLYTYCKAAQGKRKKGEKGASRQS
jgi:hypothetical protein